ncbi:hypothetical protein BH11MYX3_BH11MYX3_05140 [soil metagenome]
MAMLACGCGSHTPRQAVRRDFEVIALSDDPPGLSDLTIGPQHTLWSIAERDRVLAKITLRSHTATMHTIPIEGVPDGFDTEGLVWIGGSRFVIAMEGKQEPTAGILWAELRGGRAVVTKRRMLTSEELGVTLTPNHGAEAICGTASDLMVGLETTGTFPDGARYAPIARLRGDATTIVKFRLTSERGKLSALTCTVDGAGDAHGLAIERHFGVSRVLAFTIPRDATEVTPKIAVDLTKAMHGTLNLEGIVVLPDGRVVIVNDNQSTITEAPNELLVLRKLAPAG